MHFSGISLSDDDGRKFLPSIRHLFMITEDGKTVLLGNTFVLKGVHKESGVFKTIFKIPLTTQRTPCTDASLCQFSLLHHCRCYCTGFWMALSPVLQTYLKIGTNPVIVLCSGKMYKQKKSVPLWENWIVWYDNNSVTYDQSIGLLLKPETMDRCFIKIYVLYRFCMSALLTCEVWCVLLCNVLWLLLIFFFYYGRQNWFYI